MDVRQVFIVGVAVVLFTVFYLEKELERRQIYWLYAGAGILFGITSVYISYTALPYLDGAAYREELRKFQYYVVFGVISILMAIFYYPGGEEELLAGRGAGEAGVSRKKKGKKGKKK